MKNLIGGLFPTQESANLAYEALESAGFPEAEINMFVHKPRKKTARATDVKVQDIARYAFVGGLIGVLLGAASRLLMSREKAEVMTRQIEKRGVLVTVNVRDSQSEPRARRVMEQNGAQEVGNPSEKWDLDAWFSPNELSPSLANLVNTR